MKQDKFTQEEWEELTSFIKSLKSHIPTDKASYVWNTFNKITGNNERTPCTCSSAGHHWARAVREIETYIRSVEEQV